MSVVKINALEIPPQAGDEIVKRFTARMTSLADVAGFEGFELLSFSRPEALITFRVNLFQLLPSTSSSIILSIILKLSIWQVYNLVVHKHQQVRLVV